MRDPLEKISDLSIQVEHCGLIPYQQCWDYQKELHQALIAGEGRETLLICQHPPVITLGKSAKAENLLVEKTKLDALGIDLFEVERGGDITYHGPGQLVAYPILDLRLRRQDVGWYMRELEELVLLTLAEFGIQGFRQKGKTGVWTTDPEVELTTEKHRKIASQGVRISRWCTMHGIALNVFPQEDGFKLINPCGFNDIEISSMEEELERLGKSVEALSLEQVQSVLQEHFLRRFELN